MKKVIYVFVILLLIGLMLISSNLLYKEFKENKEQEAVFEELVELVEISNNDNDEGFTDYSTIFDKNEDMVAWIKIEGTTIDYPVMQTKDKPNYYLYRNFYKEYSSYGTPYVFENCDILNSDNITIYAHNMDDKNMFGELVKYKESDFYSNHKTIQFATKEENCNYEIIAVFKTKVYNQNCFKYYQFVKAKDKGEFDTFINKCKELSFYDTEVSAEYGDKLITLSTCEYSGKNSRLVIVAKKLN